MNAQTLASLFYTAENGNVCIRDDQPDTETVKAMVFAADQSGLGWDFAYEAVRDALQFLADTDDDEPLTADRIRNQTNEFADTSVDVYTKDRLNWLAQSLRHYQLCDEAAEDFGGFSTAESITDIIGWGQYRAYEYAMQAVAGNWQDDEEEDEDDDPNA